MSFCCLLFFRIMTLFPSYFPCVWSFPRGARSSAAQVMGAASCARETVPAEVEPGVGGMRTMGESCREEGGLHQREK